jgi:hypothetical protein
MAAPDAAELKPFFMMTRRQLYAEWKASLKEQNDLALKVLASTPPGPRRGDLDRQAWALWVRMGAVNKRLQLIDEARRAKKKRRRKGSKSGAAVKVAA